uniref:Short chain dehydrogenase (FabG) n=1 Tax=uncultured marine thaumarchaeote KM3_87_H02 TaxID=1456331 RepID=A0A075HZ95_9ARCH|nr:short chain dehydrogenase (fabG) [uncultured marine thaumarchaeote KM3_87_H02]
MKKFESISVGDKAEIIHVITQSDINQFVELTGDDNKLHVDKKFASATSFKIPVVHGMLGASFISTIIGTKLPGDGAMWYSQKLEFLQPVRIGDELRITAEVIKKIDRTKTIVLLTDIFNQHRKKVTTGTAKVKLVETILPKGKEKKTESQKTALIIGGTGGIGSAACIQLAKDGFDLAIHYYNNQNKADNLKKQIEKIGGKAVVVSGDIVSMPHVQEMKNKSIREVGNISVIVNCSTIPVPSIKFADLEWKDMQAHYDVNIRGSFNLLRAFVPTWEKEHFGKFIALTTLATEKPNAQWLPYITSKTALNGFVKALAFELAPKGIRINMVSPGMVDTPLIADIPEKVRLLSAAQTPLRSLATAQDVAGAVSFLASDKSNYLTGETIRVNGGQFML